MEGDRIRTCTRNRLIFDFPFVQPLHAHPHVLEFLQRLLAAVVAVGLPGHSKSLQGICFRDLVVLDHANFDGGFVHLFVFGGFSCPMGGRLSKH